MMSFSDFGDRADFFTHELPGEFFDELSGGVILNQEAKLHELSRPGDPLYILGEYCLDGAGRCIQLYYGSFLCVYGGLEDAELEKKLRGVIRHEFRHHMEYRSGVYDLEREDEDMLFGYCLSADID